MKAVIGEKDEDDENIRFYNSRKILPWRWGVRITLQRSPIKRDQFQVISKYNLAQDTIFMD